MSIHPTAIICPTAEIAPDVEIGPYTIIEGPAKIATGSKLSTHIHIAGDVTIGENCLIGPGAVIGTNPQSIAFDKTLPSRVVIGAHNEIREHVTIHRSEQENGVTAIGDHNFIMTGAHIGHDSVIGNKNVIANNCLLGGHVSVGNHCFLGGGSVYHQFVRIGDYVIARGIAGVGQDIPPYLIAASINRVAGLNVIGLRRGGFTPEARKGIKKAFDLIYRGGMNLSKALEAAAEQEWTAEAQQFIDFISSEKSRGVCLTLLSRD